VFLLGVVRAANIAYFFPLFRLSVILKNLNILESKTVTSKRGEKRTSKSDKKSRRSSGYHRDARRPRRRRDDVGDDTLGVQKRGKFFFTMLIYRSLFNISYA
ncbi:hypothetical protein FGIG_05754, partial [Fasciola gigantica]